MINKIADSAAQAMVGSAMAPRCSSGLWHRRYSWRADRRADRPGRARPDGGEQQRGQCRQAWPRCSKRAGAQIICSFPRQVDSYVFDELYRSGKLELELVPQGNLAEWPARRVRVLAPSSARRVTHRTGAQCRRLERKPRNQRQTPRAGVPIHGDVALIKGREGRPLGQPDLRMSARNFSPVMATAAKTTVATVHEVVELGALDPEAIVTPAST